MTHTKNTVSDERLAEMLAGLDGVTPGPWKYEGSIYEHMGAGLRSLPDDRGFAQLWKSGTVAIDAAHIARCDPDTIRSLITELQSLRASIPGGVGVKGLDISDTCDGKEQEAFEAWAASERYDMEEHPMHYLFMNPKTDAARMGWKAGIRHSRDRILSALDLSPAEGEPVAWRTEYRDIYRGKDTGWHYKYSETKPNPAPLVNGCGHRNVTPLYAAPSNPVISDEMVERVLAWVREDVLPAYGITHATRASDPEMIEALTAALSVKPQSGE